MNEQRRRKSFDAILVSAALHVVSAGNSHAAEWAYGFGYVAEWSDNIARTSTGEQDEWVHSLFAGIAYRDIGPELATNLLAQTQVDHYQNDTFDDETVNYLNAAAIWTISPQALTWSAEDILTQAVRDTTQADTPDNRTTANAFSTGPDLFFRPGAGNTVTLSARYGNVHISSEEQGSDRLSGAARWIFDINSLTSISLNHEVMQVDYEADANVDYTRTESFLGLQLKRPPSRLSLDAGRTGIKRDDGSESNGTLGRLTWFYQISSASNFSVFYVREYEDPGTVLLSDVQDPASSDPGAPASTVEAVPDVSYSRRGEASYVWASPDWEMQVRYSTREVDYDVSPQDRKEQGGYVELSQNPAGSLMTTIYGRTLETRYLDFVREDEDRSIGVRWRYRAGRALSFGLEGSKLWRTSTDQSAEYTDRRVLIGIYYTTGSLYSPVRR